MGIRFVGQYRPVGRIRVTALTVVPRILTQPSISPATAAMGSTFTGTDGTFSAATVTKREWLLNDRVVNGATGKTYISDGTGKLVYRVTAVGRGGTLTAVSAPVTITASQVVQHAPTWRTRPGLLGTYPEGSSVSIPLQADDVEGNIDTYAITGGTLPNGLSLNIFTGLLAGTLAEVEQDTSYTFEITITDRTQLTLKGNFTINVANVKTTVTWVTPNDQPVVDTAPGQPVNMNVGAQSK